LNGEETQNREAKDAVFQDGSVGTVYTEVEQDGKRIGKDLLKYALPTHVSSSDHNFHRHETYRDQRP
jgi:hypothetical protein